MPSPPLPFIRRALRRARLRGGALLALESLGEASVADVSLFLGAEPRNVVGALVGDEYYRVADSLVRLGLVSVRVVKGVHLFALTKAGREVAGWWREASPRAREVGPVVRVP